MKKTFKLVLLAVLVLHLAVSIIIYLRDEQMSMGIMIIFSCIAILLVASQGNKKRPLPLKIKSPMGKVYFKNIEQSWLTDWSHHTKAFLGYRLMIVFEGGETTQMYNVSNVVYEDNKLIITSKKLKRLTILNITTIKDMRIVDEWKNSPNLYSEGHNKLFREHLIH